LLSFDAPVDFTAGAVSNQLQEVVDKKQQAGIAHAW
jgi:hypothetical protein